MPGFNPAVVRRAIVVLLGVLALVICFLMLSKVTLRQAYAHDPDGHWAQLSREGKAPPKEWWDALASGKGLCCSFADGAAVKDVDWDTQRDASAGPDAEIHYRVRLNGRWIDVPPAAVITEPNKFGQAVVWPYADVEGVIQIRCFMPGAGT